MTCLNLTGYDGCARWPKFQRNSKQPGLPSEIALLSSVDKASTGTRMTTPMTALWIRKVKKNRKTVIRPSRDVKAQQPKSLNAICYCLTARESSLSLSLSLSLCAPLPLWHSKRTPVCVARRKQLFRAGAVPSQKASSCSGQLAYKVGTRSSLPMIVNKL
jgi:hypothetical protein